MPKLDTESLKGLLKQNVLVFDGDVKGDMVVSTYESLAVLESRESPPIEVRIFSNGGSVAAGLDIYDALRRYKGKKTGVVYAYARSMGAIILQACDERVCLPHAAVRIHHVNVSEISLDDLMDKRRLDKLKKEMTERQQALYAILARRTAKSIPQIRATCKKDRDMSAEEALGFGLIDRIEK
jgi:ATP-dependent Clp protease protease subunit